MTPTRYLLDSFDRISRGLALVRSTLLEIFDESAYARFLKRQGLESSREAYARFQRETESTRARRPGCC
jgi:hypothetical protein